MAAGGSFKNGAGKCVQNNPINPGFSKSWIHEWWNGPLWHLWRHECSFLLRQVLAQGGSHQTNLMGGWRNDRSFFRKTICYSLILKMIVARKHISLMRFGAWQGSGISPAQFPVTPALCTYSGVLNQLTSHRYKRKHINVNVTYQRQLSLLCFRSRH